MPTVPNIRELARKEIAKMLRRYRLGWIDVVPNLDEEIWKEIAPLARKVRRGLFRERYPAFYGLSRQSKKD